MANKKITSLTALGTAPATNDLVPIVDVSDTTDSANGTTKKLTVANMFTTPTIASFTNATHDHSNAAGGGQLTDTALSAAVGIAKGGTGQTTKTEAFDALAPTTTAGDIIYHNGSDNIRLAKGTAGQVLVMNSGATAPEWSSSVTPFVAQDIPFYTGTDTIAVFQVTSDTTGTVLFIGYILTTTNTTLNLVRLLKDTVSGNYYKTHTTTLAVGANSLRGLSVAGNYLYVGAIIGGNSSIRRYDKADLANVTSMTGVTAGTLDGIMFSDGTNLFSEDGADNFNKYSISGTAVTDLGAVGFTSAGNPPSGCTATSTSVYVSDSNGTSTYNIRKYTTSGGSVVSTTSPILNVSALYNGQLPQLFIANSSMLGICWVFNYISPTAVIGAGIRLVAITLP